MPNTANYSFPTPADTDLVKNGADAIRDLGDAVDTAMNTALGTKKSGLVLLNTTSFSGVSSQNITSVFSATYNRYRILVYSLASASLNELGFRFLDGTTPHTTGNYRKQQLYATSTTIAANRSTTATSWALGLVDSSNYQIMQLEVINPFQSYKPSGLINEAQDIAGNILLSMYATSCDATTAFTGFQIFPATGTITGSVSTYGYNI